MLFGWPDLYGFGDYCLMGNATAPTNPAGINDFFRADQGWIPAVDIEAGTNASYVAGVNGAGYRFVNPNNDKELFFWSNVQPQNRWSVLRGGGLLFLHYDGTIRGNDPPNPLQLAVVQADGKKDLDKTTWPAPGSDPNDFFRSGARAEFSPSTTPSSSWNNGSASGLRVHSITAGGTEMTFSVGTGVAGAPSASGGSGGGGTSSTATGGSSGRGGSTNQGGVANQGGATNQGGLASRAGASNGGMAGVGNAASGGSTQDSGGTSNTGGPSSTGGSPAIQGGRSTTGGTPSTHAGSPSAPSGGVAIGVGGIGVAGTPLNGDASSSESGCGCRIVGQTRDPGTWLSITGLAAALAFARRRRRTRARD
jgi:MYXO-CTERM domain-containing protein